EDGIRDFHVTGVQTCALPISARAARCASDPPVHSAPSPASAAHWRSPSTTSPICPTHACPTPGRDPPPGREARSRLGRPQDLARDRKSVVQGKRVELGGGLRI